MSGFFGKNVTRRQLAAVSGASLIGYLASGVSAVATTSEVKLQEFISPSGYIGFDATGATDSTEAVQLAIDYAESLSSTGAIEIRFPPGAIVNLKMVFINKGGIKLNGNGCTIVQHHDSVNSVIVGGAGQYKVSAAFLVKREAANVEITGFKFTTNDASFPALASGYGSYFPSIGGQHFDGLYIHDNIFNGGQGRFLYTQAGTNLRVLNNLISNCGLTIHIGYTLNIYFYDAYSDTTNKYSPIAPQVVGNVFDGFSGTANTTCLFLSGAIRFTVRDNKLLNMNEGTALRPLMIYSNDFGPYDFDGTALNVIHGVCSGNIVKGTFLTGIQISGDSTNATAAWTSSYMMAVSVSENTVQGTGHGIKVEAAKSVSITNNWVRVDKSPLYLDKKFGNCNVVGNFLSGEGTGQNLTTIFCNWDANSENFNFSRNKVITSTTDQYAIRATTNFIGLVMNENIFEFNSAVALCRPFVLTLGGSSVITKNRISVATSVASVFVFVLNGNANAGSLNLSENYVAASGTGATTNRFANPYSFKEVRMISNETSGPVLVEGSDRVYIRDNTMVLPSANTLNGILCDNTGYAQKCLVEIHSNYLYQPSAANEPGIKIVSNNDASLNTLSKVTMNRVEGNSNSSLIQQTTQGVIETIGNTIVNNGVGGTAIAVTGNAINTAL